MHEEPGLSNGNIKREVPKEPIYPNLSIEDEDILEDIIFRPNDELEKVDALFVFGVRSHIEEQLEFIKFLIDKELTKNIILSGGITRYEDRKVFAIPESEEFKQRLLGFVGSEINFFLEDQSTNSFDNVVFANNRGYFDPHEKIAFVCAEHVSRRDYGYLKSILKNKKILQYATPYAFGDITISKDNRRQNLKSKSIVWGEYLRLCKYGLEDGNFDVSDIYPKMKKLEKYK